RILHPERTVDVPGVHNAPLAPAGLVQWQSAFQLWIIERLHLPSDDAGFHVDVPRATAGAVDPVRAPHNFVVLPAVAIELFPRPQLRIDDILDPAQIRAPCLVALSTRARRTDFTRSFQRNPVSATKTHPRSSAIRRRIGVFHCDS